MTIQEFFKKPIEEISEEDILHVANTYDWEDIEKEPVFNLYAQRQQEQYLKWLDEEIGKAENTYKRFGLSSQTGRDWSIIHDALDQARIKFLSLTQPQ